MIRAAAALLVALGLPASTSAETIEVRSGEHADFSRLVFQMPIPIPWEVGRSSAGYEVRFRDDTAFFDVSDVFTFMPRTRILDVSPVDYGLQLDVICDCHADAFEYRPGIVVVDIKDGPAPSHSRFEASLDADETTLDGEPTPETGIEDTGSAETASEEPMQAQDVDEVMAAPTLPAVDFSGGLSGSSLQAELRANLANGVARALSQGLIELAETQVDTPPADEGSEPETSSAASVEDVRFDDLPVSVTTALDRGLGDGDAPFGGRHDCLAEEIFDLPDSDQRTEPLAYVAEARAALAAANGARDSGLVRQLAKSYIAYGFGAEAKQVLAQSDYSESDADALAAMAEIMDAPGSAAFPSLTDQATCASPAALWGYLAQGADMATADFDKEALLRSFSTLSLGLRRHLAPALSQGLRSGGHGDTAFQVRQAVLRADPQPSPALSVEQYRADDTGSVPSELADTDLSWSTSDQSVEALIEALSQYAAGSKPPDAPLITAAEAMIHETKGLEVSVRLAEAYLNALSNAGQYSLAFAFLDRLSLSERTNDYVLEDARANLFTSIAHKARDGEFVALIAAVSPGELPDVTEPALSRRIFQRLVDLGLPDEAQRFGASQPDEDNTSLIWAEGRFQVAPPQPTSPTAAAISQRAAATVSDDNGEIPAGTPNESLNAGASAPLPRLSPIEAPEAAPNADAMDVIAVGPADLDPLDTAASDVLSADAPLEVTRELVRESENLREEIEALLGGS